MTLADLGDLFAQNPDLPTPSGPDEQFSMDSLAFTWLLHLLDERGIELDPEDPALAGLTTLRRLHEHLATEHLATDRADA